jgi:hypothetical protein
MIPFEYAENGILWKVDQHSLERFKMWCWRNMQIIGYTERVKNKVLRVVKPKGISYIHENEVRLTGSITSCLATAFLK